MQSKQPKLKDLKANSVIDFPVLNLLNASGIADNNERPSCILMFGYSLYMDE